MIDPGRKSEPRGGLLGTDRIVEPPELPRPAGVAILGATGSIGRQAARVLERHPEYFEAKLLAARSDVAGLTELATRLQPDVAVLTAPPGAEARVPDAVKARLERVGYRGRLLVGEQALLDELCRQDVHVVLNAIVGFSGIRATLAALRAGKRLALANKESLVAGGGLVERALREGGGWILPVDSEHAGLYQCLRGWSLSEIRVMYLTCSGGPFRGKTTQDLATVTPEDALSHPTWKMGPKITVDSATLMNKGLEVIEAHRLFGLDYSRIRVVVHPQSVVHAIVAFRDGSSLAHLALPDMENPILFALGYPRRHEDRAGTIDWDNVLDLHFEPPDTGTFRCLALAYEAGRKGGAYPCVLNAANEIAVEAFLEKRLSFLGIAAVVEEVLLEDWSVHPSDLDELVEVDSRARALAGEVVGRIGGRQEAKAV